MNQGEQQNEQVKENDGLALGIDFGNSKISAAVWDEKKRIPILLYDENKKYQFPATMNFKGGKSSVNVGSSNSVGGNYIAPPEEYKVQSGEGGGNFEEDNAYNFGPSEDVMNGDGPAIGVDFHIGENLDSYVYNLKKIIGQKSDNPDTQNIIKNLSYNVITDKNNEILLNIDDNKGIPLDEVVKYFFEKIKNLAMKKYNNKKIGCATISVPHGFNNSQKKAIIRAASNADIPNIHIINDPLSTAIYYASQNKIPRTEYFLIIDFGSSKLDVTILSISQNNSIKVKFSGGDSNFGGDVLNEELLKEVLETYINQQGGNNVSREPSKYFILKQAVEKAKIDLTFKLETKIKIPKLDGNSDLNYEIKREEFDDFNRDLYNQILSLIDNVVKEYEELKDAKPITHVILQGDAIRVATLTKMIETKYQDLDVISNLYDAVAYGSAIFAAKKKGLLSNEKYKDFKISDITPLSLGIRTEGELMSVIIKRGSRIPTKAVQTFITTQDNQTSIKFEIFEGERKLIRDNTKLNRIILKDIPQRNKGEVKVEICFEVDEESILHVTATETTTKASVSCDADINDNLSQSDIKMKIEEAKKVEKEDIVEKERIQAMLKLNDKIFEYNHLFEGNEDILRELETFRNWIKHSSSVSKEEYEKKLKELNDVMTKDKNEQKKTKKKNGNKKPQKKEEEKNPETK